MINNSAKIFIVFSGLLIANRCLTVAKLDTLRISVGDVKALPRFWTNTGFCPPAPIHDNATIDFFLSDDVSTNIEMIGALPNQALSTIRIHWLLNLVRIK